MRANGGPYIAGAIAKACGGTLLTGDPATEFEAISTDSRDINPNDLFVPLNGANFNGHDFLIPALGAGARGSLVNRDVNRELHLNLTNRVLIQVKDTLLALADLASTHRSLYSVPLIAVTGSSGKTTVKEMIATVLRRSHHPLVSQGNLNNMIGLPMTVLNLGPQYTAAVVEAGINTFGEMEHLARAAAPDTAVITTAGPVHLEGLGSVRNVAIEKTKIAMGLKEGGTLVIPEDHDLLKECAAKYPVKILTFGVDKGDFHTENLRPDSGFSFVLHGPDCAQEITLRVPGIHNVKNALAAAAALWSLGIPLSQTTDALSEFASPSWRLETLALPGDRVLIRDCYNANPQSMAAALEVLANYRNPASTLAVLADMMELGERSAELHSEIGALAARLGITKLVFLGRFCDAFAEGFTKAGGAKEAVSCFPDKDQAWEHILPLLNDFGIILVKGSRFMKMEILADRILGER
jgi:UDP-N-acetylmuramoyl-tripeptide--D-alanyl-D-alanine ligase